ncbi:MAG TPA: hypothetical protein VGU02_01675 [Gaiellaceae bacterium]|nr:hypothetical protein [Gaiellaceae bacterium]
MKKLLAALVALAALVVVGGASADPLRYGVADDWPKFHPCGDVWWKSAADIGYQDLRITVQWDGPGTAIPAPDGVKLAVDCALLSNVRPIVAIYPARPSLIGSDPAAQAAFAAYVAQVGQAYPGVKNVIVGNEPNVNRFWQPQYAAGQDAAGKDYEHTLAQAYDALKSVRPDSVVWGPAISSRGNDNASAASNPSHSPVWFIKDMGDAYRASGRTTPIFDEFNMHPYPPVQDTDPFSKAFRWPQAGAANLDRIKQALWDAFNGTGQPVPAEQAGGRTTQSARFSGQGLPLNLDEVGEQTDVMASPHAAAYTSPPENVHPISEQQQSQAYTDLMEIAACDPDVKSLLFFPLIDESPVSTGFQSGQLYADDSPKASYAGVKTKIASSQGQCQGGIAGIPQGWVHATSVIGAQAYFGGAGTAAGSQPAAHPLVSRYFAISFTATEDTAWTLQLHRLASKTARPTGVPAATVTGTAHAYFRPLAQLPPKAQKAGWYDYSLQLTAAVNPARTVTFFSRAFAIGKPGPALKKHHTAKKAVNKKK